MRPNKMRFKYCCAVDIPSLARKDRTSRREDMLGIGAEIYDIPTPMNISRSATSGSAENHVNQMFVTETANQSHSRRTASFLAQKKRPKRLASAPPNFEPEPKKSKVSQDAAEVDGAITTHVDEQQATSRASTSSSDKPGVLLKQTQEDTVNATTKDTTTSPELEPTSNNSSVSAHKLHSPIQQLGEAADNTAGEGTAQNDVSINAEPSPARQKWTRTLDPSKAGTTKGASNTAISNGVQDIDQSTTQAASASKESSTSPNKNGSTQATTADAAESEDDDLIIIEVRNTSATKRKAAVTPKDGPAKKKSTATGSPNKNNRQSIASTRHSLATPTKSNSARGKAAAASAIQEAEASEEDEDEGSSEEAEDDDNSDYDERAKEASHRALNAKKQVDRACRSCKISASREMKAMYEAKLSEEKNKRQSEKRKSKKAVADEKKTAKSRFDREKEQLKERLEEVIEDLKKDKANKIEEHKEKFGKTEDAWRKKFSDMKMKLGAEKREIDADWENKYKDMRAKLEEKNRRLTQERDNAEQHRKNAEKENNETSREMRDVQSAAGREVREARKQMQREKEEEVNELKPEFSVELKGKEKNIKELLEKVLDLERQLRIAHDDYHTAGSNARANQIRNEDYGAELRKVREQTVLAERNLWEFEQHVTRVEQRSKSEVARAEEGRLRAEEANALAGERKAQAEAAETRAKDLLQVEVAKAFDRSQRLVEQQRISCQTKETLRMHAQLSREKSAEIAALKAELEKMKAEVGLSTEMDGL